MRNWKKYFNKIYLIILISCIALISFLFTSYFLHKQTETYQPKIKRLAEDISSDWGLEAIKSNTVLIRKMNLNKVTIAVIDSGVSLKADRILPGYNILDQSRNTYDDIGHGSDVASIILKSCPNAYILPIKIVSENGYQDPKELAAAVCWAIEKKTDIINISLGTDVENEDVRYQISRAIERNIPVICSAGNSGDDQNLMFPARLTNVISVVSRDINNVDEGFSNRSKKKSFSAPGVHIKTVGDKYVSGTSFSSAFVSGVVGIVKGIRHDITIKELLEVMKSTSVDGNYFSYGLIQTDKIISSINPQN